MVSIDAVEACGDDVNVAEDNFWSWVIASGWSKIRDLYQMNQSNVRIPTSWSLTPNFVE